MADLQLSKPGDAGYNLPVRKSSELKGRSDELIDRWHFERVALSLGFSRGC